MKILVQVCSACCRRFRRPHTSHNLIPRVTFRYHSTFLPVSNQTGKFSSFHCSTNYAPRNCPGFQASCLNFVTNDGSFRREYSSLSLNQNKSLDHVLAAPRYIRHTLPLGAPVVRNESTGAGASTMAYLPTPVELTYEYLEYLHDDVCLSWWLTIIAVTMIYKGVMVFPLAVLQQRVFARIENAQPEINTLVERYKQQIALIAKEKNWSKAQHQSEFDKSVKVLVRSVHLKERCGPPRLGYVVLAQLGVWVTVTMALGQMSGWHPELFFTETDIDILPTLATEGALWFTDLMQADLALPVMLGLVNLTLVELWSLRKGPLSRMQHRFQNVARLAAIGSIPAATLMPSVISFYWLVSSLFGLAQYAVLRVPVVRRTLGIPQAPSEMRQPLTEIRTALKIKYLGKKVF